MKTVYCLAERPGRDGSGYLKPVAEVTANGIEAIDTASFPNTGLIKLRFDYSKLVESSLAKGRRIYVADAEEYSMWDPETSHAGHSKYTTSYLQVREARALDISEVITGNYPNMDSAGGLSCTSELLPPLDAFYLGCTSPKGYPVVIGPLEVVKESTKQNPNGMFTFRYRPLTRQLGGFWAELAEVSNSAFEIDRSLIPTSSFIETEAGDFIVGSLKDFAHSKIDLSTPDQLVKWARKVNIGDPEKIKDTVSNLRQILHDFDSEDFNGQAEINSKISRLESLEGRLGTIEQFRDWARDYLKSPEGDFILSNYVLTNRDSLLERFEEEQKNAAQERVEQFQNEQRVKLRTENQKLLENRDALQAEVDELQATTEAQLQQDIDELRKEHNLLDEFIQLEARHKIIQEQCDVLGEDIKQREVMKKAIEREIREESINHTQSLMKLKMQLSAIQSAEPASPAVKAKVIPFNNKRSFKTSESNIDARDQYADLILTEFTNRGRNVSREFLLSLVTLVTQNMVVTLAGEPGTGKTSLATVFAEVTGLNDANRFTAVQVQRGWTSERELLGFFNRLSGQYEPDRHGLYEMILGTHELPIEEQQALVLLDEANLSSIEHYWSVFMAACDNRELFSLEGSREAKLPGGLRFIATTNFDQTTERLSPRFLDRSPVIYLEGSSNISLGTPISDDLDATVEVAWTDYEEMFLPPKGVDFSPDERRFIAAELFGDNELRGVIPQSRRKLEKLRSFTCTLRENLGGDLAALDYAISSIFLPSLEGNSPEYESKLRSLDSKLRGAGLQHSAEQVQRVIDSEAFGFYSFFS